MYKLDYCLNSYVCRVIFVLFFVIIMTSCVHNKSVASSDVYIISDKTAKKIKIKKKKPRLFISSQQKESEILIVEKVQEDLINHGFKIVKKPSSADLILQITIPFVGDMRLAGLQTSVGLGYDGKVSAGGGEVSGLIADILLVTRSVPEAKNEKQAKLKNISQRQAIASSTVRLGAYSGLQSLKPLPGSFVAALSTEICKSVVWILSK